MSYSPTH